MKRFQNKKLLVLGSNVGSCDIVNYAKEHGAYTIVADYLPVEKSPAKKIADEHMLISTGDIESLKDVIKEKSIDAVLAGVSEFNLLNAMKLCNHFHLPFYCNIEQWNMIEHKDSFRKLCNLYNVPTPKTYISGSLDFDIDSIKEYPVVVKPVDCGASIGVYICENREELLHNVKASMEVSDNKRIIIEEFFEGDEFTAHYTIVNKKVSLSSVDNRYPIAINDGNVTTIPIARTYPSEFISEYMIKVNPQVYFMCESLGLETGVVFVQGLYNKKKKQFAIFEAGLRCAGEAAYRLIDHINGINFLHNIVDYSLGVPIEIDLSKDDPTMKGKFCGVVSLVGKGGVIGDIIGFDSIKNKISNIIDSECRYMVGMEVPNGNTLRQIIIRFTLVCDNKDEFVDCVNQINNEVYVKDLNGDDMCLKFDSNSVYTKFC